MSAASVMSSEPSSNPVPRAPPPWALHGDAHGLLVWMPKRSREDERAHTLAGPRLMLFVRYVSSNVGPYDELLWLEPYGPRLGQHTVTRIYVSTEASATHGRANWGIPKELAAFAVTSLGPRAERIEVAAAGRHVASFTVAWGKLTLPLNARLLPAAWRTLVQVADGRCFKTAPSARGRLSRARFSDLTINPMSFPDANQGSQLAGFSLRAFDMSFPLPEVTTE